MSTLTQQLITAEQFYNLPHPTDGSRQELIRGVVNSMPPPGTYHGVCCARLARRLGTHAEENNLGHVASNDSGFITERDPDTVRGPDLSFWSLERLPQLPAEGYVAVVPDLVVEVVSPSDVFARISKKVEHYLRHQVNLIWVVLPAERSVTVYRLGREQRTLGDAETLTGEEVLPGFSCPVAALFPEVAPSYTSRGQE